MGKIKKIISTFVILLSIFTFSTIKADAATGTISISSNKSTVVVGDSVKFTVTVSSPKYMVALQYDISYNSSMFNLTSGNSSDAPVFSGNGVKSKTYTFTFKAKKAGTASLTFNAVGATMEGDEEVKFTSKSKSVKIITQAELEASYSSNNKLSSLAVEGYTLSPSFSSTVTSYTVNLPANTESINITGKKADSSASVEGLGKKTVEDGSNTIKIVVTAENGSTKTYTINAIVEELDPITVTINSKDYTVVRKAKLLESPNSDFIENTTTIDENEVPTLFNEKANLTLVGLKDSEGNIELYIYNKDENTYTKYNQLTFSGLTLYIIDKEVENNNNKKELNINDEIVTAYILNDNYYYFYAINLTTGKENLYRYDEDENTVQKEIIKEESVIVEEKNDDEIYKYIIIGLLGFIFLTYIIILISLLLKGKKKKNTEVEAPIIEKISSDNELSKEEKEIHEEIEKIGTQELQLRDLKNKKEDKVSSLEKEKLIRETEEELNRITNEKTNDENDLNELVNEVFEKEEPKNKKTKTKKSKKKKDKTI